MFAIVRTGGKQYRVAAGDKIVVEKLPGEAGSTVSLGDVLLAGEGAELKDEKVVIFKKRRRHNYRRRNGHRQQHTILKILSIGGEAKAKKTPAKAKADAPVAAEA
jgi:large subunit ribosomal protein L21